MHIVYYPVKRGEMNRFNDPHIVQGNMEGMVGKEINLPPENPVQPKVSTPCELHHSTALKMFGLLPDPLMAMSRSPSRQDFELLKKNAIETLIIAPSKEIGTVVS